MEMERDWRNWRNWEGWDGMKRRKRVGVEREWEGVLEGTWKR